jgi:hypothetical protein
LEILGKADYRQKWQRKKAWYEKNGFVPEENLFTTEDDEKGGLDSASVKAAAEEIRELL